MKEAYSGKNQFEKINKTKEKSQDEKIGMDFKGKDGDKGNSDLKGKKDTYKDEDFYKSFKNGSKEDLKEKNQNVCDCGDDCTCENSDEHTCNCNSSEDEKERKITQLEVKMKDYLFTAQRLQADFDNFRKKTETRIEQANLDGRIEVISKLLPALDSFAGAKKMIKDETVLEGLLLVEKQIISALESLKVEKIEAVGKVFDPNLHNALAVIEDSSIENDIVKEEYQSGYKLNDKVIRHSQVIVNKKEEK